MRHFSSIFLLASAAALLGAGALAATPDLDGVWQVVTPITALTTLDGTAPPLNPAAEKIYDQRKAELAAGNRAAFDSTLKCKPMGEPRTAYDPAGGPFEILQDNEEKEIVFGYTWNRMVRFVYLTGKAPEVIGPSYYATATGAWHGNKLVLDVEGLHDTVFLDASGMPHSENLKLTETFQLAGQGRLLDETIRFDDPATFTRPWETKVTYRKLPAGTRIQEDVCEERLHVTAY